MSDAKMNKETENVSTEVFEQTEFRNIKIYNMHKEVVAEFFDYCKRNTGGRHSSGIHLLLSKAKAFDLMLGMDMRLKALEHQMGLLMQKGSVEEHSNLKHEVKTIGGV
jgi:hypothetical protein